MDTVIKQSLKNRINISFIALLFVFSSCCYFSANALAVTADNNDGGNSNSSNESKLKEWLDFSDDPEMPIPNGIAGGFIGRYGEVAILAGGFNFSNEEKTYHDDIYVLRETDGSLQWQHAGDLPRPVAYGASVSTSQGLLCLGGENGDEIYDNVFFLRWDQQTEKIVLDSTVPNLPKPATRLSVAILENKIYLAGGRDADGETKKFRSLSLEDVNSSNWQNLPTWPGPARLGAALIGRHIEDKAFVYLFSGKNKDNLLKDGYKYNPREQVWQSTAELPRPAVSAPVLSSGQSHILVFSGSDNGDIENLSTIEEDNSFYKDVLSYHTVTDTWGRVGQMQEPAVNTSAIKWDDRFIIPGGQVSPGKCTEAVQSFAFKSPARLFGFLDQFCLYTYLTLIMLLGFFLYYFKDQNTSDGFFLGGRKIPGWAAGLSLMATGVSSIGFMAIPSKTFVSDWTYFVGVMSWVLVIPVVIIAFIPFFMRFKVTTAYELLERRFDVKVRTFAALGFSLMEIGRISIVLLLPATALATVTNLSTEQTILLMGIFTTIYTVSAGMQGVIWSDVCQGFLMIGGALLCIIMVVIRTEAGLGELLSIANADAKFKLVHLDWSPASTGLWVVLVGNVFHRISSMTANQASVQRFLSTSGKKQATRSVVTSVLASLPWALIVFLLGTALYVFYKTNPSSLSPQIRDIQVLPFFMAQELPVGLSGIIIAAIFAAGMSSIDSAMHSLSTTWTNDFLKRFFPRYSERARLIFAKSLIVFLGMVSTVGALMIYYADVRSMWDFFIGYFGLFSGVLCGIFVLAIFFKRVSANGAFLSGIAAFIVMQIVWSKGVVHPLLYAAVGVVACMVFGYFFGLLNGHRQQNS